MTPNDPHITSNDEHDVAGHAVDENAAHGAHDDSAATTGAAEPGSGHRPGDPNQTDHPTGEKQAAENRDNEPAG